jgi:hypothetical protein
MRSARVDVANDGVADDHDARIECSMTAETNSLKSRDRGKVWRGDVGLSEPDHSRGAKDLLLPPDNTGVARDGYRAHRTPIYGMLVFCCMKYSKVPTSPANIHYPQDSGNNERRSARWLRNGGSLSPGS